MRRPIKFRAWDKVYKHMITDEQDFIPLMITNKGVLRLSPHHSETLWEMMDAERFELMQYTGLCDRNGKEIYEGDILKTDLAYSYLVVEFRHGSFMYMCRDDGDYYYDSMVPIDDQDNFQETYLEIHGNIYTHPHLMEVSNG